MFGFLMDVAAVIDIDDLESLRKHCADFAGTYEGDIDGSCLMQEIIDCLMLFRNRQYSEAEKPNYATTSEGYNIIRQRCLPEPTHNSPDYADCVRVSCKLRTLIR